MSRGPGRIERAIEAAFTGQAGRCWLVEDLVPVAYPGVNLPAKSHRVAVLRAADKVSLRLGWHRYTSERPGGHIVYCNPFDLRSYALGRERADFLNNGLSMREIEHLLDTPGIHRSKHDRVQPGGAYYQHVEIHRLQRDGEHERAAEIIRDIRAKVAKEIAGIGRPPGQG